MAKGGYFLVINMDVCFSIYIQRNATEEGHKKTEANKETRDYHIIQCTEFAKKKERAKKQHKKHTRNKADYIINFSESFFTEYAIHKIASNTGQVYYRGNNLDLQYLFTITFQKSPAQFSEE